MSDRAIYYERGDAKPTRHDAWKAVLDAEPVSYEDAIEHLLVAVDYYRLCPGENQRREVMFAKLDAVEAFQADEEDEE